MEDHLKSDQEISISVKKNLEHGYFCCTEKAMATHSSVLAWRIPGTAEPGGLPSVGSQSRTRLKRLSSSSISVAALQAE